jgi:SAM-dependent methyltransferase
MRNKLVLWGHHVDEYQDMFDLSKANFKCRLLEYGCGPTAINAELHAKNNSVISCDPLFELSAEVLAAKIDGIIEDRIIRARLRQNQFDVSRYGNLDDFLAYRREGLAAFFADYALGKGEHRYRPIPEGKLSFGDFSFDLALCANYLFADPDDQDIELHLQVISELVRVAKEVRIFPLDHLGHISTMLGPVLLGLQQRNFGVEVRQVKYPSSTPGGAMLRVWAQECVLS